MNRRIERLCWLGALLIAIAIGLSVGKVSGRNHTGDSQDQEGAHDPKLGNSRDGSESSRPPKAKGPGELNRRLTGALLTQERTDRFQKLAWVLDEVTPANWQELWEEYIRLTLEDGRVHELEWQFFMNRVGEVDGPGAIEYFQTHGQSEYTFNRREVLRGWAGVDPEGAATWLSSQPQDSPNQSLWPALVSAVAGTNPDQAINIVGGLDPEKQNRLVAPMVDSMIQLEGIKGAIQRLQSLADQVPDGEAPPPLLESYYSTLRDRAGRMDWLGNAYPEFERDAPDFTALDERFGRE